MVAHIYNSSTREVEARRLSLRLAWVVHRLLSEMVSKIIKYKTNKSKNKVGSRALCEEGYDMVPYMEAR